jgi:O-antigen/teichoic acid export membrane protein
MKDLKARTISGGAARLAAQAATFALRLGSLMVLARLLSPREFGLVGMVTAFTGILDLCRDFGLSAATVQRESVTDGQISTLFWVNVGLGTLLAMLMTSLAPVIAHFYHEPRLVAVTVVLALAMLFNAAGVQHAALLQREMRYTTLAVISVGALLTGTAIAIIGAKAGYGYWALVAMSVAVPFGNTMGYWIAARWIPSLPRRRTGVRSMLRFGSTLTLTGLTYYITSNIEKVLIGRFWGAAAIGLYGRAYQLISIPTSNLNSAAGEVAFAALSRIQNDPARRRSYFLKGFSLVLALTLPLTIGSEFFAPDVVRVLLGSKWMGAVPIFRWLAPTMLVFAVTNPLSWLLSSSGRVGRLARLTLAIAPTMIIGYVIGLPYGPKGVACAYSVVMTLWLFPLIAWCTHEMEVSFWDIMRTVWPPFASSVVAGILALAAGVWVGASVVPVLRLILESSVLFAAFIACLMAGAAQRSLYIDLLRTALGLLPRKHKQPVAAY